MIQAPIQLQFNVWKSRFFIGYGTLHGDVLFIMSNTAEVWIKS